MRKRVRVRKMPKERNPPKIRIKSPPPYLPACIPHPQDIFIVDMTRPLMLS